MTRDDARTGWRTAMRAGRICGAPVAPLVPFAAAAQKATPRSAAARAPEVDVLPSQIIEPLYRWCAIRSRQRCPGPGQLPRCGCYWLQHVLLGAAASAAARRNTVVGVPCRSNSADGAGDRKPGGSDPCDQCDPGRCASAASCGCADLNLNASGGTRAHFLAVHMPS